MQALTSHFSTAFHLAWILSDYFESFLLGQWTPLKNYQYTVGVSSKGLYEFNHLGQRSGGGGGGIKVRVFNSVSKKIWVKMTKDLM